MKTAVSVPDELFRTADEAARDLRMSRSQLYATALAEFLERRDAAAITAQLDRVYARSRRNWTSRCTGRNWHLWIGIGR